MSLFEDVKAILVNKDESVGHIMSRRLLRDGDGTYVTDSEGHYVWGPYEPAEFDDDWNELGATPIVIRGTEYSIRNVHQTGGMDEGSRASVTFEIDGHYFRMNGFYASHYGYDWDGDFEEVRPVEQTVIVYESI